MRAILSFVLTALAASMLCSSQTVPQKPPSTHTKPDQTTHVTPDDLFFNGVIYTGVGFAQDQPQTVEAMAIGGGKVLAVGTTAKVSRLAGPKTHMHDLATARTHIFVFPGFNDAHTHLGGAGR